ncbi:Plasmodium exported protein, unknown function [Plasmodium vivax]|uniref:Fam-l protein n=1 Tax=Plasmodium vivax TaxID=5855 RepID=A0A1G4EC17_PLAVI|nr:Plasmodium exported protein, unknown function [Plasmodium vivax]
MAILKNIRFNQKVKFLFIIKILTFVILFLAKNNCHDERVIDKSYKNEKKHLIRLDIRTQRLLAKHERKYELRSTSLKYKNPEYGDSYNKLNDEKYYPAYKNTKVGRSNNLEAYKTNYNMRYAKKKGLQKLDCYYEKKVFDNFGKIEELVEKINNKRASKSVIYKKYCLKPILIFLFPLLGLIIPIYLKVNNGHFISYCKTEKIKMPNGTKDKINHIDCGRLELASTVLNTIFFCGFLFLSLSALIYIYKKHVKYENLKAGKWKMN